MENELLSTNSRSDILILGLRPSAGPIFQGHAFVGSDFIFGQQGALDYEAQTGSPVAPGEDGCYVTLARNASGYNVGVDHNGAKKLFYFRDNQAWAISNSLVLLAEHLRERNIPLTVNFPQLNAFQASGTFASQQATTNSIFNEVKLLPTTRDLVVTNAGLELRRGQSENANDAESYQDALDRYVSTWLSRVRTLLRDRRTWLNVDLSGGVDSRTVFALVAGASRAEGDRSTQQQIHLRSSTAPGQVDDLTAATEVAHHHGWELNQPIEGRPPLLRFTGEERYTGWRDLSVGVYTSVYFPDRRAHPLVISFHGSGGGHRPSYLADTMEDQLAAIRYASPGYLAEAWKRDVLRETSLLTQAWPWAPPLISHYHEYRNRFHSGLLPQYSTVVAPLGSRHIDSLSRHPQKVQTGQIIFDVMESLFPGLKDMSYSTSSRSPSAINLANMTLSSAADQSVPGKTFGSHDPAEVNPARAPREHLELMADEFERSQTNLVSEFLGDQAVVDAANGIDAATNAGRFAHPGDGKLVSRVLATAFAFSMAEIN